MSDPTQAPRQTTRVMQAVQASHGRKDTGPRYALGSILLGFALASFALHMQSHTAALDVFEQRFIGGCGAAGLLILPPAEAGIRLALSIFSRVKPTGGGQ